MQNQTSAPIALHVFRGMTQDQLLQVIDNITGLAEQGIEHIDAAPQGTSAELIKTLRAAFGAIGYQADLAVTDVDLSVDLKATWGLRAAA